MTRRIGGMMDYSKLVPSEATDSLVTVAERARRMCLDGRSLHDIASALRVHPEQVRRWLAAVEHREAAAVHARAWSSERERPPAETSPKGDGNHGNT